MLKVVALTANKVDPSSRFRFRQFIEPLAQHDISVSEHYLPMTRFRRQPLASIALALRIPGVMASRRADITWLRRELIPERATLERFTGGRRIFDVDDAIWLLSKSDFSERIVAVCDAVIAGNEVLAEHYRAMGKPVWLVPTCLDTDYWVPGSHDNDEERWVFGWIGTNSNLRFLHSIEDPLAAFLKDHPRSVLRVICDRRPQFKKMEPDRWQFIKWSADTELEMTQSLRAGLMPIDDSEWSRGKCGFKMIQYMSVGRPVVVSPFGVNREILETANVGYGAVSKDDWYEGLRLLYNDPDAARSMGDAGRKLVDEKFSVRENVTKIVEIFREVSSM